MTLKFIHTLFGIPTSNYICSRREFTRYEAKGHSDLQTVHRTPQPKTVSQFWIPTSSNIGDILRI